MRSRPRARIHRRRMKQRVPTASRKTRSRRKREAPLHPSPDHGKRHALHHHRTRRSRKPDCERRRAGTLARTRSLRSDGEARLVSASQNAIRAAAPPAACGCITAAGDGRGLVDAQAQAQIPLKGALKALKPLLEDPSVLKIGQNMKYDTHGHVREHGVDTRAARRHDADVLRARRRRPRSRHGRAFRVAPRPQADPLLGSCGQGQVAHHFRSGADRQGGRLCGRGRRRDAQALAHIEAASCR